MINGPAVCEWQEWQNLSEDQRRYELHRILATLDRRTLELLRVVRWYSFFGGLIGGSLTVLGVLGVKLITGGVP
jgi:hypothetical protein